MSTLHESLKICLTTPGCAGMSGLPLLIWGPPGAAKTAIINETAEDLNLHLETVLLSVREPADVAGLPVVDKKDGMRLEAPAWAKRLADAKEGILFFDELSCAAPATQAAALRIVAERVVGELQLPPGIRVIAATNTAEQAAGGWDLAAPLANRFIHIDHHGPKLNAWIDWLIESSATATYNASDIDKSKIVKLLSGKMWSKNFAKAMGLVTAFLTRKAGMLGPDVPKEPSQASRAWPSPRSWELATRAIAGAWCHDILPYAMLAGAVGEGPANEFMTYIAEVDLPDPRMLLRGEEKFSHKPARLDRSVAVLNSVAAYVKEEPKLAPAAWKIIGQVLNDAPDIAVPASRSLVKAELADSDEATEALAILQPLLSTTNYQGS